MAGTLAATASSVGRTMAARGPASRFSPIAVRETLVVLAVLDVSIVLNNSWLAQAVALVLLFTLPGYLVLRALHFSLAGMTRSPGWIPAISIVALTAIALIINLVGPVLGIDRPLDTVPLALGVNFACLGLAVLPGPGSPLSAAGAACRSVDRRALLALLVPLLATMATLRLNNGYSDPLPVVAAGAAVALIVVTLWRAPRWSTQRLAWLLTSATLALLLGYSLRSDFVFGWDVSAEYRLLVDTAEAGVWPTSHPGDSYGAMLSLTALPTLLQSLAGTSALVLLKLVYPILFSLVPIIVMVMLRSVFTARVALIGSALLLTQLSFIQEMPALARQEIAMLLFVSILAAMLDRSLGLRQQLVLLVMLATGIVVSHYSTTYTLITVVAGAVLVQLVFARWHGVPAFDPLKLVVLATALLTGIVWYQGVTSSTEQAVDTVGRVIGSGLQILPSAEGEDPLQSYLRGPQPPATLTVKEYQAGVEADFGLNRPWVVLEPSASAVRWALKPAAPLEEVLASPLKSGSNLAALLFSQLLIVVCVAGTAILVLRRRVTRPLLDFAILSSASIAVLGLARLSSEIANSYGQDRLYLQLMPIVAVPVLWMLGAAWAKVDDTASRIGGSAWQRSRILLRRVLVFGFCAYLVLLIAMPVGLISAAAGDRSAANLYDGGEHYRRFYVTAPEVAAAEWMGQVQETGSLTYADGHAQLRISGYGVPKGPILTDLAPGTVDANSWIYASRVNTVLHRANSYFADQWVTYEFPRDFLVNRIGVAYSNGSAEVFHR